MKRTYYLIFFFVLFAFPLSLIAQEKKPSSKFSIAAYSGIGYGKLSSTESPRYNMDYNGGDFLFNYRFAEEFSIGLGYGYERLSGTAFNQDGVFSRDMSLIKVPLVLSFDIFSTDKISMIGAVGVYGRNIQKDKKHFMTHTESVSYKNWAFGTQFNVGISYNVFDNFDLGVQFMNQSDFSKYKTKDRTQEIKLSEFSAVGLFVRIGL